MVAAASRCARSMDCSPIEIVTSGSAMNSTPWLMIPAHMLPSPPRNAQKKPSPTPNTIGGTAKGRAPSPASTRDSRAPVDHSR